MAENEMPEAHHTAKPVEPLLYQVRSKQTTLLTKHYIGLFSMSPLST